MKQKEFNYRCKYRHITDQIILPQPFYAINSQVIITPNLNEIQEEFQIDDDMRNKIISIQKYCGTKGKIISRSQYGWYLVQLRDSKKEWFTPYCLLLESSQDKTQKYTYRTEYRQSKNIDKDVIPQQKYYERNAKVQITPNQEDIEEELQNDPDMKNKIQKIKQYCGCFGKIISRSQYGWLKVQLEDNTTEWFTPYCLLLLEQNQTLINENKIIQFMNPIKTVTPKNKIKIDNSQNQNYGFNHIELVHEGEQKEERQSMLNWVGQNKAVLSIMKKFKFRTNILKEINGSEGLWGHNISHGSIIRIRLWEYQGQLRPRWDVLLTAIHELAHNHYQVESYGGGPGHSEVWKSFYKHLINILIDEGIHGLSNVDIIMFLEEFHRDYENYQNGKIIKRL